ncbi:hypothetical protein J7T55_005436 [Diaporthe amygdali]|uniref:uncharacterized protein n=1 Tax=Phomopsis amygdali TaxID=1214568 RepID=UPI0022FEC9F6|nr:uncharacterized protein J7T55_005436 [Diaporthe amygdali]KAJ0108893.1 hypothetical protein J7T55_005436 [Diaporthe amygdali]
MIDGMVQLIPVDAVIAALASDLPSHIIVATCTLPRPTILAALVMASSPSSNSVQSHNKRQDIRMRLQPSLRCCDFMPTEAPARSVPATDRQRRPGRQGCLLPQSESCPSHKIAPSVRSLGLGLSAHAWPGTMLNTPVLPQSHLARGKTLMVPHGLGGTSEFKKTAAYKSTKN